MPADPKPGPLPRTMEEKRALWRAGKARFPVPPVCTAFWTEDDWIRSVPEDGWDPQPAQTIEAVGFLWDRQPDGLYQKREAMDRSILESAPDSSCDGRS